MGISHLYNGFLRQSNLLVGPGYCSHSLGKKLAALTTSKVEPSSKYPGQLVLYPKHIGVYTGSYGLVARIQDLGSLSIWFVHVVFPLHLELFFRLGPQVASHVSSSKLCSNWEKSWLKLQNWVTAGPTKKVWAKSLGYQRTPKKINKLISYIIIYYVHLCTTIATMLYSVALFTAKPTIFAGFIILCEQCSKGLVFLKALRLRECLRTPGFCLCEVLIASPFQL